MTICKYHLPIEQMTTVTMPQGAKVIHVGLDPNGEPCLWAEVEPGNERKEVFFAVLGTGHESGASPRRHIGSFVDAPFVWHVYHIL